MAPPTDFSDLSTAYNASSGTSVSVIGVVADLMAPKTISCGDWMITFKLLDPKLRDAVYGSQGLTVRFFKRDYEHLPVVRNLGDIVLLRNIAVTQYQRQPLLLGTATRQSRVVVFPAASIPDPTFHVAYQGTQRLECFGAPFDKEDVTLQEQAYVMALKHDMKDTVGGLSSTNHLKGLTAMPSLSTMQYEPAAKKLRLSEPSLLAQPPPNAPLGPAAGRSRQPDGLPQPVSAVPARHSSFGPKFKTVKELAHFDFADICAQVVKKYPLPYGGFDLYVTDYTTNEAMWYYTPPEEDRDMERDGDMFGYAGGPPKRQFPGPYGWNVLKINVKDPHADTVNRKVAEDDFIHLRNVKMKIMREGAKLEGDMWPDPRNPEKSYVSKLIDHSLPEIQELLQRKEKYWASRKSKVENQENAKLSKSEKRSKKKKAKAEKKAAEAGALDALLKEQSKADVNPHVRCSHDDVPITSVKVMLDAECERHTNTPPGGEESYIIPFINAKYRARVRVVDYEPKDLEDFAIPADSEHEDDKSVNSIDGMDWETSQKYIWSFRLLLEDTSTTKTTTSAGKGEGEQHNRIWAVFTHENAQYLFGNAMDDPADLRLDNRLLAKLREKMCILWGNLEERQASHSSCQNTQLDQDAVEQMAQQEVKLSNRPFECCIMEYGVPVGDEEDMEAEMAQGRGECGFGFGYKRVYGAFGVTIT